VCSSDLNRILSKWDVTVETDFKKLQIEPNSWIL
jgi:hypothetical protein